MKEPTETNATTSTSPRMAPPAGAAAGAAAGGAAENDGQNAAALAAAAAHLPPPVMLSQQQGILPFRGNPAKDAQEPEAWVESVNRLVTMMKWTPQQAAGAATECMRDEAARWLENLKNDRRKRNMVTDWTLLAPEFSKKWGTRRTQTAKVQYISNLQQRPAETTSLYQDRVTHAINKLIKDRMDKYVIEDEINAFLNCREAFEIALFVTGLHKELRQFVEWEMKDDSTSEQVFEFAKRAEEAFHSKNKDKAKVAAITDESLDLAKELKDIKAIISKSDTEEVAAVTKGQPKRKPLKDKPMSERPAVFCFKCKQWGKHILKECKLSAEDISRLTPQSKADKPKGQVKDTQFPNA